MKTHVAILTSIILTATAAFAQTTILWNESVNGELSQGPSPTLLGSLQAGTNSIIGATEIVPYGNNWGSYPEVITFEIPINYEVTELYIQIDKPNVWVFLGDPTFLSSFAFSFGPTSGDLLAQWGLDSLSADAYGMYLENHDHSSSESIAHYQLDFVLEPIPEPGTLVLLLLGAGIFTLRHCRKSQKRVETGRFLVL